MTKKIIDMIISIETARNTNENKEALVQHKGIKRTYIVHLT